MRHEPFNSALNALEEADEAIFVVSEPFKPLKWFTQNIIKVEKEIVALARAEKINDLDPWSH
jgi:hypothetical protein